MLGYASPSIVAPRRFSPTAIAFIVGGHAALLALVVSAKMEFIPTTPFGPTILIPIAEPIPPEAAPRTDAKPTTQPRPQAERPTATVPLVADLPIVGAPSAGELIVPTGPFLPNEVIFEPPPLPLKVVRRPAALVTPDSRLRPPYPLSK